MDQINDIKRDRKNQINLFSDQKNNNELIFRPIHYLGSKLRILEFINSTIDSIEPRKGRVCDLFAGSGTVSKYLSQTRPVTAIDIQEYSRVITSALLRPSRNDCSGNLFIDKCKDSKRYKELLWCSEPLLNYETYCMEKAQQGEPIPLCDLIESGSIISFTQGYKINCSCELKKVLHTTVSRLEKMGLLLSPSSLIFRYFGGLYFSYLQAVKLDALLEEIHLHNETSRDTYLAALLSTASEIVNTVGKTVCSTYKA